MCSKGLEITITGTWSGDNECFCWEVSEEEYIRICGKDSYDMEMKIQKEMREDGIPTGDIIWRLYPGDLLRAMGVEYKEGVVRKFTLGVEAIDVQT